MRVVIIGGTRFIGPEVVRQLMKHGHEVTVFHRGQTNDERTARARHILGDRANLPSFREQFKNLHPDIVLDMLPLNGPDADLAVASIRGIVPRVIAISSMDVYRGYGILWNTEKGPIEPTPFGEDSPLRSSTEPHGEKHDKIAVERIVMNQPDFSGTILRLPMVYGKNDRQHRLFEYLKRMMDNRPAILMDKARADWRWTRGYLENVAAAICLAITDDRAAGKIYNVGEASALTEAEWVEKIGRCMRWPGKVVIVPKECLPEHLQSEYNFNQHMEGDTGRIREELGYTEPVQFEEALIRTIAWEQHHPPDTIDPDDYDYEKEDEALETYEGAGTEI
jgi:nucleoside-diphosphate-sugar epimerase